jgi:hypothetical protein
MSVLKQVFVVLLGLSGLALLVSFVLPSRWEVSREMVLNVWPQEVHAVAGDLDTWKAWSPWSLGADPAAVIQASPQSDRLGSTLSWVGPELGKGSLELTRLDRDKGLEFELRLRDGKELVHGALRYGEISTGATNVVFTLRGDVGGDPIGRYRAIARGYTMGPSVVEALARLKDLAERR